MFLVRLLYAGMLSVIVDYMCSGIETGSWMLVAGCVLVGALTTTLADSVRLTK